MIANPQEATDPFEIKLRGAFDEMVTLLMKKRQAYGAGNLTRFGGIGIVVRTSDKVERLANLYQSVQVVGADGDTIEDAWQDLIGYGVLGLLFQREQTGGER